MKLIKVWADSLVVWSFINFIFYVVIPALAIMPSHEQNTHIFTDRYTNMYEIFNNYICSASHMCPGPWFNIKMTSYQYRKSHCGDKTILRPSYLHNGISYTDKMTSLYRIRVQDSIFKMPGMSPPFHIMLWQTTLPQLIANYITGHWGQLVLALALITSP